jgi:predicted Zn-dependent peptidase
MVFKKTELKNGIRVVTELHPSSRAVSIGVWVLTGTRDEASTEAGISHFVEHLVFKNTKTRTAYQIAKSLEALGGELNAYTTREYTVYHCLLLKDHWRKGLEVLSDLVSNMQLKKSDFELERSVILQEIGMAEDDLEDLIYDIYFEKSLPRSSLGKPILGNIKSITNMKMRQVNEYYQKYYSANNIIVAAAGSLDHHDLVTAVEEFLGHKKKRKFKTDRTKPVHKVTRTVLEKNSEQLHLCMGLPVTSFRDRNRFDAFIVNALLGGGMTSRLYQSVREKRGLAYTVYSSLNTFDNFGCINIYASCEQKNMKAVFKSIQQEITKLRKQKVSEHDLEMYKTQVKGAILLGSDDVENRMTSIAVNEMVFHKYKAVDQVIEEIDSVSVKSVNDFINKYIRVKNLSVVLMGGGAKELEPYFLGKEAK